ncbi:hypothetical protein GIB67_000678 [Kingdonia uniflora]|uniref:Uncharacterized protein n=1 Tax=Kingdonia uniflora TaxID=39325 RepID=A0A7J7NDF6_9MAGN|nr:hypothetical protein GIB67_000678 [Kingdonia uniflora]
MVIVSIHSINTLLGCGRFSWPSSLSSSLANAIVWLNAYGKILILTIRGIMTATVAIVEEFSGHDYLRKLLWILGINEHLHVFLRDPSMYIKEIFDIMKNLRHGMKVFLCMLLYGVVVLNDCYTGL